MAWVALIVISVIDLAGTYLIVRSERATHRAWEREKAKMQDQINTLIDRIMYVVDRPWNLPEPVGHIDEPRELIYADQLPLDD